MGDPKNGFPTKYLEIKTKSIFCFSFSGDIEEKFLPSAGGKVRDIFNTHLVQLEMNRPMFSVS